MSVASEPGPAQRAVDKRNTSFSILWLVMISLAVLTISITKRLLLLILIITIVIITIIALRTVQAVCICGLY